ncbi:sensor histidine kinase [Chryseobacterium defluvii]|uniref:Histidine kinase/DNA gyrase B/HSP90-like ATPase n=1 Tax=Chryseobacterium defluvii TaxID=160396 RepID=A0A495SPF4_9FLAO|nr:histidine kinase [Chryseobacterium defluvii]RKT01956.1 histidine kinase/DNA gyrase B/HSP90-like ATPase [Chryseobacterium defluvii]
MRKIQYLFTTVFIILFSSLYFAQIPGLVNYNDEDGLNNSYTYQIRQDHKGFIWIGSDNGLYRFDGKEFKQYGKKEGLRNIEILSCMPLSNGEIFIIPFLDDFAYIKNNKIINSEINKELKKIQFTNTPGIARNKDEIYLYNSFTPKTIFVYKNGKIREAPLVPNYQKKSPMPIIGFDFDHHLTYLLSKKGEIIIYHTITKKETICPIESGSSISLFEHKGLFFSMEDKKVSIFKLENHSFKKINSYESKEVIHNIIVDKNNKLWLALENGGVLFFDHPITEKLPPPVKLMDQYVINDILVDSDNNVWFTSAKNGVFFIAEKFFRNYISLPIQNNSSHITAIAGNSEYIFLGYNESYGGIFHADRIDDIVFEKNGKTEHRGVYANDNIAIFGLSRKVFLYDIHTREKHLLKNYLLKNIVPYTDTSVLLCTPAGLTIYDFVKKSSLDISVDERVYSALPYTKDSLFIGSFKNLYKFSLRTKRKTLFLEGYYFTDLKKLKSDLYVGATNLKGLILFNHNGIIKEITEKDGLMTDKIKRVDVENENIFWASTNSGLHRIERKGNNIRINTFTQTDGLPSNVIAGCVIRKDSIYIGTSKGLGAFSIKKLLTQQKFINKKVVINSVVIGGKEYFDFNRELAGKSPGNDVILNLSFPDYTSQEKISYRYKIEGLNDHWQTSNSSKIILNAIPPGKYTFKVFGLGYNGKQSYVSSDLSFEIKPHFWQTWWFTVLMMLSAIGILSLLIILYSQKRRNEKLDALYYEKKIAELELQAIKAQINPHFIYNCLNSIQFLLYKKDYTETENYLEIFSQMIRKTLHYSEKTFMPVKDEIEYLSLYLDMEKLRLKDQFDYTISVSEKVDDSWVIPSLLIQPFVENAIKHGVSGLKDRKGHIEVSFDHTDASLCITIEDNGVGIDNKYKSSDKSNSFGVRLSQKRIETFKQLFDTNIILKINSLSEKQGTQIKLYITPYENQNTSLHH